MGMLVAVTSAQAANAPVLAWSPTTSSGTYDFGTVDGVGGKTATQTFTLTNSGDSASAMLTVTLPGSSAFSIIVDGCTATSLGPNKSCGVTVTFAPTVSGESDSATLTAQGKKADANASITLSGQGGTPDLSVTPGTLTAPPPYYGLGTKNYNYDFGPVGSGSSVAQTFTVTNSGTGTSNTLQLAGCCNTGFTLSNDQTTGSTLAPGGTATFELTSSPSCTGPTLFATPLNVNAQDNGSPYVSVLYTATCGPPITSVTATLFNLANPFGGNPQFVSIGSGNVAGIAVIGTLTNHSFRASPLGALHGFTIQIPFSITAGALNCDMSRSYAPGTCSVSNNVMTVTENFPPGFWFGWRPVRSQQIGYAYVGSSLDLGAWVTWGPPLLTAVR
jgi:hypothetical protein